MFARWKLSRQIRQEIDMKSLEREAVEWTKAYFKSRRIPHWTSEYQHTFGIHVLKYVQGYTRAYVKSRLQQITAASPK